MFKISCIQVANRKWRLLERPRCHNLTGLDVKNYTFDISVPAELKKNIVLQYLLDPKRMRT